MLRLTVNKSDDTCSLAVWTDNADRELDRLGKHLDRKIKKRLTDGVRLVEAELDREQAGEFLDAVAEADLFDVEELRERLCERDEE